MSQKFDLYDKQGRKIGEARPQNSEFEGLAGCLMLSSIFAVIFFPIYATYKFGRYGWESSNIGWVITAIISFGVICLAAAGASSSNAALTGSSNGPAGLIGVCILFAVTYYVGYSQKQVEDSTGQYIYEDDQVKQIK